MPNQKPEYLEKWNFNLSTTGRESNMGDRKPKKNSSGNGDAHKSKSAKNQAERPPTPPRADDGGKGKKK